MKNPGITLLFLLATSAAFSQLPETDIFISEVKNQNGKYEFLSPVNITKRHGYDNQPFFMPDGKSLLYVAVPDTTQADIFRYDFTSGKITPVTRTKESEYSPMLSPDGKSISVVRVDADQGQRFYKFPVSKTDAASHLKGTDSIGYYCWLDDSSLAMFMLGNAMTLQILNTNNYERKLIASDIGRCMRLSSDKKLFYFVIKQNENEWAIFEMNLASGNKRKVVSTISGSEDFALMPDGSFLMGSKGKLYRHTPGGDNDWMEVADFSSVLGDFYRISVNQRGDRIAMVAFTGKKP